MADERMSRLPSVGPSYEPPRVRLRREERERIRAEREAQKPLKNPYEVAFERYVDMAGYREKGVACYITVDDLDEHADTYNKAFQELVAASEAGTIHPPLSEELLQKVGDLAVKPVSDHVIERWESTVEISDDFYIDRADVLHSVVEHGLRSLPITY